MTCRQNDALNGEELCDGDGEKTFNFSPIKGKQGNAETLPVGAICAVLQNQALHACAQREDA